MKTLKALTIVRIEYREFAFESEKDAISFFSIAKKSLKTNTFNGIGYATRLESRVSLQNENEGVKLISPSEFERLEDIEREEYAQKIRAENKNKQEGNEKSDGNTQ